MAKKIGIIIGLIIIISIIGIFVTFDQRHRVSIDHYRVNEYVEMGPYHMFIKGVNVYNFNRYNPSDERVVKRVGMNSKLVEFLYNIDESGTLNQVYLDWLLFIKRPFNKEADLLEYVLIGEVFLQEDQLVEGVIGDFSSVGDGFYQAYDFSLINQERDQQHALNTGGMQTEDHITSFSFTRRRESQSFDFKGLQVSWSDEEVLYIPIESPVETVKISYWNREAYIGVLNRGNNQDIDDQVKQYISLQHHGQPYEDLLLNENEHFDLDLSQDWIQGEKYYKASYIGDYKEWTKVSRVQVSCVGYEALVDIYLVYQPLQWKIVDVVVSKE